MSKCTPTGHLWYITIHVYIKPGTFIKSLQMSHKIQQNETTLMKTDRTSLSSGMHDMEK